MLKMILLIENQLSIEMQEFEKSNKNIKNTYYVKILFVFLSRLTKMPFAWACG